MAEYGWNPFQERTDCHIKDEVIKTASDTKLVFAPRYAPFFSGKNFALRRQGITKPLELGQDYVFAHSFDRFINKYQRNVFGAIVLRKPINAVLIAEYDTIGAPFVQDAVGYATLIANLVNAPRSADWSAVVNAPSGFPLDPHPHPLSQTYDWLECMTQLKSLVLALVETSPDDTSLKKLLQDHLSATGAKAHPYDKADMGLDLVQNMRPATFDDLAGNSNNATVSIAVMKEAFRLLAANKLKLD